MHCYFSVKTEQTCRVEGLSLKSKIKPTSLTKSSGPNIEKDVVSAIITILRGENSLYTTDISSSVNSITFFVTSIDTTEDLKPCLYMLL